MTRLSRRSSRRGASARRGERARNGCSCNPGRRNRGRAASTHGGWPAECSGTAADVQRLPILTYGVTDRHQAAIAGYPPKRFRGNARAILQRSGPGAVRAEHVLIEMNHDLEALPTGSLHRMACQERLGDRHRAVCPRWPARFRGNAATFRRLVVRGAGGWSRPESPARRAPPGHGPLPGGSSPLAICSSTNSNLTIPPGNCRRRTERSSGAGALSPSFTAR